MFDTSQSLLFVTLLAIHALLEPSTPGAGFTTPQSDQSYMTCAYGANKVGQGAVAGLFSSQIKYSLASLLLGEPKFEISGECGSG